MVDFVEIPIDESNPSFVAEVPLIQTGEKVKGGDVTAPANKQAAALAMRTAWLKLQFAALAAKGLNVVGTLETQADLDAIDTTNLGSGTAYFVEAQLQVWNGTEWVGSGSLLGPRGISLLGTWPDAQELPDISSNEIGDAYIWKGDIHLLIPKGVKPNETREWTSIGLKGPDGDSAYKIAQDIDGFQGTKAQWLASLVGKSAYQTWVDNGNPTGTQAEFLLWVKADDNYQVWLADGNVGDRAAFLATLKSTTPGPAGPARGPFSVEGSVATVQDLPMPGDADKAYYIGSHLFVWVVSQSEYIDLGSVGGLSAYELWKAEGNQGDLQAFFEAYRSTVEGPKGEDGKNVAVKGTLANQAALAGLQNAKEQDAYALRDTGNLWILIDGTWTDTGPWRGKSNYDLYVDSGGGLSLGEWLASLEGQNGKDGVSLKLTDTVATYSALPAAPKEQDVYAVQDINCLFAYVGAAWRLMGEFKGKDGDNGQNGSSINVLKILTPEDNVPPPAVGNAGQSYIDLNGHINISNNSAWVDVGPVGVAGPAGPQGNGFKLKGTVPNSGYLPVETAAANGDAYLTAVDKMMYILVDGAWAGPFDLVGPKGEDGKQGEKGDPGTSINIMGDYATQADLVAAHATGNLGEGYLIGSHLWIWTTADGGKWIDVGEVRGPQGIQGPPGKDSKVPGPRGERGTVWITLPAGQDAPSQGFAGNTGDWAVSDTFKVYYRTLNSGWVFWGQLVAGDVNSPLESLGKVVRLGDEWVALPVDEVPNMVAGKLYVRHLKNGSTDNEGEWTELVFPASIAEPPSDGNLYVRTVAANAQTGTWVKQGKLLPEVPDDGKLYGRKNPTAVAGDADATWTEIVIPTNFVPEAPEDGKIYGRRNPTAVAGASDAVWVEIVSAVSIAEPAADGTPYMRVRVNGQAVGSWATYTAPTLAGLGGVALSELGISVAQLVNGTVPASQLPSYVDDVVEFDTFSKFPATGEKGKIYIADDTNVQYRWSGTQYIGLVASPGTSDAVAEGNNNLYFTQARVRSTPLAGISFSTNSAIAAGDTVLTAFGKLQAQITAFVPGFADVPTDTNLYLRKGDHTWSLYTPPAAGISAPAGGADGKTYVYRNNVWVSFDFYDLLMVAATTELDLSTARVFSIANSSARTLTFKAGTTPGATRSATIVLIINGAGVITWPANIVWNGSAQPALGATTTVVTLLWDGIGNRWIGSAGATI